jgi:hypothetical protein
VQQIRDQPHETQASSQDDELIFGAEFLEKVLLVCLSTSVSIIHMVAEHHVRTRGSESFTGCAPLQLAMMHGSSSDLQASAGGVHGVGIKQQLYQAHSNETYFRQQEKSIFTTKLTDPDVTA